MSCLKQDQVNIDQVNLGGDVSIENVLSGNASSARRAAKKIARPKRGRRNAGSAPANTRRARIA